MFSSAPRSLVAPMARLLAVSVFAITLGLMPACAGCDTTPANPDAGEPDGEGVPCSFDDECGTGEICSGGLCTQQTVEPEVGPGVSPEPTVTPEPVPEDAGPPPAGRIEILPSEFIEFGAQLLGVPVEREVTVVNTGTAPANVLAILLDDDSGEFSSSPDGTLQEALAPGDSLVVTVSHTPADGTPDEAELKILHDAGDNLTTVTLFAEFKGDADFAVHEDTTSAEENATTVDFGEVTPGVATTRTLFVRNTGRSDSILELRDLTITPTNGGFTLVDFNENDLPITLASWASGLCPDGDVAVCPEGADACTGEVCVTDTGAPLHAYPVVVEFTPGTVAEEATLTFEHNAPGESDQHDINLLGTPTQPNVVVTPSSIAFGPHLVGATTAEIPFSIANDGDGPLVISLIELPDGLSAFEVDFDAPVPTQVGHPAITVASGAPALTGTVTFTPAAAEGYTGFIVVTSNDGDDASLSIPMSGAGVVCPPNSEVTPDGECGCGAGFVECATGCVLESEVACGASCNDCTAVALGAGTDASCVASTCEYSCREQYYDLDSDLDTTPTAGSWDGCEYLCPRATPQAEQCNGIDDDCNGISDEGLAPDPGDDPNPATQTNDTCSSPLTSREVDGTVQLTSKLYPVNDEDWFAIRSIENDEDVCLPCLGGADSCESYRTTFTLLNVPDGRDYTLEIRLADSGCASTPLSTGDSFVYNWTKCPGPSEFLCLLDAAFGFPLAGENGGCGFNDFTDFTVRVRGVGAQPQTCESYMLQVQHEAL